MEIWKEERQGNIGLPELKPGYPPATDSSYSFSHRNTIPEIVSKTKYESNSQFTIFHTRE